MSRSIRLRLFAFLFCGIALAVAYNKSRTEAMMLDTATRFIDSLTPEQRAGTLLEFNSKNRTEWHYFPERGFKTEYKRDRHGIMFKEMSLSQRFMAQALLSAGLSQAGFIKAMKVMTLEDVVRVMEADTTGHRDAERYHFAVFGKPSATGTWGWRIEGHHLSLNFVIRNGRMVSSTPTFFGGNPHEAPEGSGPLKGMRALEREEDLGMALVNSFDAKQRKQAIFLDIAPYDLITMATVRAKLEGEPQGLPASKMNDKQVEALMTLIAEYAENMPPDVAAGRMKAARETPRSKLFFGWAGETSRTPPKPVVIGNVTTGNRVEKGNYYRIQSPTFLVEYDNTQNQGNHSHSVWRDFQGDFGLDALALHHRTDHSSGAVGGF
ncbi:MAG: DUF3500 domain-containing protein [Bryobacteraceae bacterium]